MCAASLGWVRIDLHTHTHHSDGTDSPAELMANAAAAGLDVIGLTDHDTVAGWQEAAAHVPASGVALVPGAELSCTASGISVHLLSFLHDPKDPDLRRESTRARESRDGRAREIVRRVSADYAITWADVQAQAGPDATIGRPHIADALVAKGHVPDRSAAFGHILAAGGPYYVSYYAPDVIKAVRIVRAAGGVPILAHPRARARGRVIGDAVIAAMADAGLAGLEVDHRDHTDADREHLRALAADLGLLITGASDYHGTGKHNRLGEHTTSPETLEAIEAQGRGRIIRP